MTVPDVPPSVRKQFRLPDLPARPLDGGMVTPMVIGDVVLKPVDDAVLASWCQGVLASTVADGVVIPEPLAARDGRWVVDGWTATDFIDGLRSLIHEPESVVAAGREFAKAVNEAWANNGSGDFGRSPVQARTDRWARAYRHVWLAEPCRIGPEAQEILAAFRAFWELRSSSGRSRLFHCDLTGNVLADQAGRRVVVDFTPAIGPPEFGTAVVVADHLLWHDGRSDLVDRVGVDLGLLARAVAFRLVAEQLALAEGEVPSHGGHLHEYRHVLRLFDWAGPVSSAAT